MELSSPRRPGPRLPEEGRPLLAADEDDPDADRLSSASSPAPATAAAEESPPRLKADLSSFCIMLLLLAAAGGSAWSWNGSGSGWSLGMARLTGLGFLEVCEKWREDCNRRGVTGFHVETSLDFFFFLEVGYNWLVLYIAVCGV